MYFIFHPKEVMSSRCVNTYLIGYNNWRCYIDTHLTFPVLSCAPKALSDNCLQILKLRFYLVSNALGGA